MYITIQATTNHIVCINKLQTDKKHSTFLLPSISTSYYFSLSHSNTLSIPFQFYLPLGSRIPDNTQLGSKYFSVPYFHLLFYPCVRRADGDRRKTPQTVVSVTFWSETACSVLMCCRYQSVWPSEQLQDFQLQHQFLELVRTGTHISECHTQLTLLLLEPQS